MFKADKHDPNMILDDPAALAERLALASNSHEVLVRDLTERAGNLETAAAYLREWERAGVVKPAGADTPTIRNLIEGLEICGREARAALALAREG